MPRNLRLLLTGFIFIVALISIIFFFSTISSHLLPEYMSAKAIPLAILSGLSLIALSLTNKDIFKK
ncbi:hypothetical protein [Bacillus sp. REN3]|uniref:hypothetical protein n=1 Tax=Bacillus sp. REN3 TaxID=2802440 RepID=UPI001AEDE131|nr:hypothetical protein [Bacillus sp. REN3]